MQTAAQGGNHVGAQSDARQTAEHLALPVAAGGRVWPADPFSLDF